MFAISKNARLRKAAATGRLEKATRLLAAGANPNARGSQGDTPLILAARNRRTEIVKLLLERGADPNARGSQGDIPLILAVRNCPTEIVKLLLERGADPNLLDDKESTPIHVASAEGNEAAVNCLIEAGAAPGTVDSRGNTPLHQAALHGHRGIAEAILATEVPIDPRNSDGETPLQCALKRNDAGLAVLLVRKGADPNQEAPAGKSGLHWASEGPWPSESGQLELLDALVERGAELERRDGQGNTALILACSRGPTAPVKALLGAGLFTAFSPMDAEVTVTGTITENGEEQTFEATETLVVSQPTINLAAPTVQMYGNSSPGGLRHHQDRGVGGPTRQLAFASNDGDVRP